LTLTALAGLALAAGSGSASADVTVAGVRFDTTVECGGSTILFTANTLMDGGSYARLSVWDAPTRRWISDGVWQPVDAWSSFHVADITFSPGTYVVYLEYAQSTTAGWQYGGEQISSFVQRSGLSRSSSGTCSMGG